MSFVHACRPRSRRPAVSSSVRAVDAGKELWVVREDDRAPAAAWQERVAR
jgi:hypothetical protein